MAQKPYKHNIEYIQKFYSYGSEAKVIEFKPVYQEEQKPVVPKQEREPVTTIFIDPIAFCGIMVAIVMVLVTLLWTLGSAKWSTGYFRALTMMNVANAMNALFMKKR